MSDYLTSLVRNAVPAAWTVFLGWLVSLGVPGGLTEILSNAGAQILVPVAILAVSAAFRWIESRVPAWLAAILMGSPRQPIYPSPGDVNPLDGGRAL